MQALVGPFLELAMVEEPQLKEAGLTLYFSTLTREFSATRTFRGVETQTIDALDKIVNERFASSASNASLTGLTRSGSTIGRPVGAMITSATSTQAQQAADSFKKYFRATLNVRFEAEKDEALREHGTVHSILWSHHRWPYRLADGRLLLPLPLVDRRSVVPAGHGEDRGSVHGAARAAQGLR